MRPFFVDLLFAFAFVAGGVGVALQVADQPSADFWTKNSGLAVATRIALGVAPMKSVVDAYRLKRKRIDLHRPLVTGYRILLERCGCEHWRSLLVTAFLVRWRLGGSWAIRRELVNVRRVGLKIRPSSGIRWVKGKGLMGLAWLRNKEQKIDFRANWASHPNGDLSTCDKAAWDALAPEARFGLDVHQRDWTLDHAPAVVVTPIQSKRGRFIGCVVVECTPDVLEAVWALGEQIQDAAQSVAHELRR